MYVILVYDISTENNGATTQRKVFKICKRFLTHIQNSVFEGELTKVQLERLKTELKNTIRKEIDSVIIFTSRNEKWLSKEIFGNTTQQREPIQFL